jgi:hypothetical protein
MFEHAVRISTPLMLLGFVAAATTPVLAADVVSVEEHWSLTVGGPEVEKSCPQISLVMSPTGNLDDDYFVFNLNHATFPNFVAGGLQLQHWDGDQVVSVKDAPDDEVLFHDNEVIQWKQRMWLNGGYLKMKVFDGTSQSWGDFGGWYELRLTKSTELIRLNDYRPAVSINESGITYAGNRVSSLVLQKLIWTTDDGQTHVLEAPIDIHATLDP